MRLRGENMSGSRLQRPRGWQAAALTLLVAVLLVLSACGGQPEPQQPAAPSNVVATAGPGYVSVSWQDNSDNETGFEVYRTTGSTLTAQQTGSPLATVPANQTSFVDLNIELEQAYVYSVVATG